MPKFLAKMHTIDLVAGNREEGSFYPTLVRAIKTQINMAARAFVRIASASVPVRTGFARGVFRNILEAAGAPGGRGGGTATGGNLGFLQSLRGTNIDASRHPNIKKAFSLTKGGLKAAGARGIPIEYYTGHGGRVLKTPQSGRRFASPPKRIIYEDRNVFVFSFEVLITYFNINDLKKNPRTPSSPWNSYLRGRAFFLQYMATTGLKRLPQVQDFFVEHEINSTGSTVRKTRLAVIGRGTRFKFNG